MSYQPKTGKKCLCKPGAQRDNCSNCEGTGWEIDFAKIRERAHLTKTMTPKLLGLLNELEGVPKTETIALANYIRNVIGECDIEIMRSSISLEECVVHKLETLKKWVLFSFKYIEGD